VVVLLLVPRVVHAQLPPSGFLDDLTPWIPPASYQESPSRLGAELDRQVEDGRLTHALIIAGIILQGFDTYLTIKSRMVDNLSEGNLHLAGPLADRPGVVIAAKALASTATSLILWRAHRENPKVTARVASGIVAGYGWVVGHDLKQFHKVGAPIF